MYISVSTCAFQIKTKCFCALRRKALCFHLVLNFVSYFAWSIICVWQFLTLNNFLSLTSLVPENCWGDDEHPNFCCDYSSFRLIKGTGEVTEVFPHKSSQNPWRTLASFSSLQFIHIITLGLSVMYGVVWNRLFSIWYPCEICLLVVSLREWWTFG